MILLFVLVMGLYILRILERGGGVVLGGAVGGVVHGACPDLVVYVLES